MILHVHPSSILILFWSFLAGATWALAILWWWTWRVNKDTCSLAMGWSVLWLAVAFTAIALIRSSWDKWDVQILYVQRTAFAISVVMGWVAFDAYMARYSEQLPTLWKWRFWGK